MADSKGNFNVEAEVDPDNNISECVENNNTFNTEVTVLSVPPTNIAINKTVYVSSVEKSGVEGNYAVDGSLSSRWSSQFSDPQYIYIDLGKVTHIEEIDLFWEYAYGKEYFLQVSDDAVSWRDLDHITNGDGGQDMFQVSTDARYVRMYGIKRGTVYGYSLYEFEVYSSLTATGLHSEKDKSSIPSKFFLDHNYPNPFNPSTTIKYGLPEASKIKIIIYNTLGQKVTELVNSEMNAGFHQVTWDASNCSSGIYICMLETDKFKSARKLVLMK